MTGTVIYWDESYHNGRIAEDQSDAFLYHFSQRDFEDGRKVPALGDRVSFFRGRDKIKITKGKVYRTAVQLKVFMEKDSLAELTESEEEDEEQLVLEED
jgi:hypothetical protein